MKYITSSILLLMFFIQPLFATNTFDEAVSACNGDYAVWISIDGRHVHNHVDYSKIEGDKGDIIRYIPTIVTAKVKELTNGNYEGYFVENGMSIEYNPIDFTATTNSDLVSILCPNGETVIYKVDKRAFMIPIEPTFYFYKSHYIQKVDGLYPEWAKANSSSGFTYIGCSKF